MGKGHYEDLPEVMQLFPDTKQVPDLSQMSLYELASYFRKRIGVPYRDLIKLCSFNHWKKSCPEDGSIDLLCRRLCLSKEEEHDLRQVAEKERGDHPRRKGGRPRKSAGSQS